MEYLLGDWALREVFYTMLSLLGMCVLSCVRLFAAPWTVARQAPLPMECFLQECWTGVPFLTLEDLLDPRIEPGSLLHWQADFFFFFFLPSYHLGSLLSHLFPIQSYAFDTPLVLIVQARETKVNGLLKVVL